MIKLGLGIDEDEVAAEEPSAAVPDEIPLLRAMRMRLAWKKLIRLEVHSWKTCVLV